MERIAVDDLDPDHPGEGVRRWRLSDRLGTTDVALNRYRIAPGEGVPWGLHAHADQEELFVVLDGEATFETLRRHEGKSETGEVTVGPGEAIRFAPGEFQRGRNAGDRELLLLAVGAPRDSEDTRIPVACPACGRGELRLELGPDGATLACPDCGAERVPEDCPECGGELRVTLGEDEDTAVVCGECDAEFERAPLADPGNSG